MIGWEVPRPPVKYRLLVESDNGPRPREATDEDLRSAGYVKAPSDVEAREAEAWRKIDTWLRANPDTRAVMITPANGGTKWYAVPMRCTHIDIVSRTGYLPWHWHDTKTEALEALAKRCEAHP